MKVRNQVKIGLAILILLLFAVNLYAREGGNSLPKIGDGQENAGVFKGTFEVDSNGTATYNIPLNLPPGINGFQPNLGLIYNSQTGDGLMGQGWMLNGLSAITRCFRNPRYDDPNTDTAFEDRFAVDGQRLIAVMDAAGNLLITDEARNAAYGQEGTVYHLANETWTKVISHGSDQPTWFEAFSKDGYRVQFGNTIDSRIPTDTGSGYVGFRQWSVNKITDPNGNYLTVTYANNGQGQFWPDEIDYTGNNNGFDPNRKLVFTYEDRPDQEKKYVCASMMVLTKRLKTISTYAGNALVKSYQLDYQVGSQNQSQLVKITQYDQDGNWLRPIQSTWMSSQDGWSAYLPVNSLGSTTPANATIYPVFTGDWNGDGKSDIGYFDKRNALFFSGAEGAWSLIQNKMLADFTVGQGYVNTTIYPLYIGDWNGDGRTDIGRVGQNCVYFYSSTSTGWSPYAQIDELSPKQGYTNANKYPTFVGDWDGDGRTDIGRVTANNIVFYRSTGSDWQATGSIAELSPAQGYTDANIYPVFTGDWNGDGKMDIGRVSYGWISFYLSTSNGWQRYVTIDDLCPSKNYTDGMKFPVIVGDWNGDGKSDFGRVTPDGISFYLSTGRGWQACGSITDFSQKKYVEGIHYPIFTGDWNGDGKTDIGRATDDGVAYYISCYGNWVSYPVLNDCSLKQGATDIFKSPVLIGDWNGDGVTDFGRITNKLKFFQTIYSSNSVVPKTSNITDSVGMRISINYKPLTDPSVYSMGSGSQYPIRDVIIPRPVVSSYTTDADNPTLAATHCYQYNGGKQQLDGTGWLGFAEMTINNVTSGIFTNIRYSQQTPSQGQMLSTTIILANGKNQICKTLSYANNKPYGDTIPVYQVLKASERADYYTSAGNFMYTELKSYSYDKYGNQTEEQVAGDTALEKVLYTCKQYQNDETNWRFGVVTNIKRAKTSTTNFSTWDPNVDLSWDQLEYTNDSRMNILNARKYDDQNQCWLTTTYSYDDFGNILTQTDPLGGELKSEYDPTYQTFISKKTSPPNQAGVRLVEQFTYDPGSGQILQKVDANGNTMQYRYNGFGILTQVSGPDNNGGNQTLQKYYTYYGTNGKGIITQTLKRVNWNDSNDANWDWRKDYQDEFLRTYRVEIRGPENNVIAWDKLFNAQEQLVKETMPYFTESTPNWITYQYNPAGQLAGQTLPNGLRSTIIDGWDAVNRARTFTRMVEPGSPNQTVDVQKIDAWGNVVSQSYPDNSATNFTYDLAGKLTEVIDPDGLENDTTYTSLGTKCSFTSQDNGTTVFQYTNGLLAAKTFANGKQIQYSYDKLGRVLTETVVGERQTTYTYDQGVNGKGKLYGVQVKTLADDRVESVYQYDYDVYGNCARTVVTIDDQSYVFAANYNFQGKAIQTVYPDNAVLTYNYFYDGILNSLAIQDATSGVRNETSFPIATYSNYTAEGQPGTLQYGNNITSTFTYNNQTQTLSEVTVVKNDGSKLLQRQYTWDNRMKIIKIDDLDQTGPNESQQFSYDTVGRLVTAVAGDTYGSKNYAYSSGGRLTLKDNVSYTQFIGNKTMSGTEAGQAYMNATYDANGNMIAKTVAGDNWQYTYDGKNQLTEVRKNGVLMSSYTYDYNGRRIKAIDYYGSGTTTRYYASPDYEVTIAGGTAGTTYTKYINGLDGRVSSISKRASDVQLLPAKALGPIIGLPGFSLLAQGVNFQIFFHALALGLGTAVFLFIMSAAIGIYRFRRSNVWTRPYPMAFRYGSIVLIACVVLQFIPTETVAAKSKPIRSIQPGVVGTFYYHQDNVRSTGLVTDGNGQVVFHGIHDPYGQLDRQHSSGSEIYLDDFTGKDFDDCSGLYYYGARYYDPQLGRFINADTGLGAEPLENAAAFNRYAYAGSNPVMYIDPSGEAAFLALLIPVIVGAIIGVIMGFACEAMTQLITNGVITDWSRVGLSALFGGISGALFSGLGCGINMLGQIMAKAGYSMATVLATCSAMGAVAGGGIATLSQLGLNAANGDDLRNGLLQAAILGVITGGISGIINARVGWGVGRTDVNRGDVCRSIVAHDGVSMGDLLRISAQEVNGFRWSAGDYFTNSIVIPGGFSAFSLLKQLPPFNLAQNTADEVGTKDFLPLVAKDYAGMNFGIVGFRKISFADDLQWTDDQFQKKLLGKKR